MIYLRLFWSFFQIGLFSFGGGYAALPLIQEQVVNRNGYLSMAALTDLITISQMTPGPIALNASTFVGAQVGGLPGALVATLGCITPSCIIVSLLAFLYFRYRSLTGIQGALYGLRPAVVALIASAGLSLLLTALWGEGGFQLQAPDLIACVLFVSCFFVLRRWRPNPIFIMAGTGVVGAVLYLLFPDFGHQAPI